MTARITDLEGRLDAAFKRADRRAARVGPPYSQRALMRTRAEWCPCANGGRGGWAYYRGQQQVAPPKDRRVRARLIRAGGRTRS